MPCPAVPRVLFLVSFPSMWLLFACTVNPDDSAAVWELPAFNELPEQADPPNPLTMFASGEAITTEAAWWEQRAPEILLLFQHYVYGYAPEHASVETRLVATHGQQGETQEWTVSVGGVAIDVVAFLPAATGGPYPVLLGLNKCGNHSVSAEFALRVPTSWPDPDCGDDAGESGRGSHASEWPYAAANARGFAVVTLAQSDLDPDDDNAAARKGRLRDVFTPNSPEEHEWGTIAAWSWGLSHVVEALEKIPLLDADRVMVLGHSRRGKAALWAKANDSRIAAVWAHQSGIVGAALNRGSTGETVAAINTLYPHWFTPAFHDFSQNESRLPVDQHELIALVAPRSLLVTDGDDDFWANPAGADEALALSQPVRDLVGGETTREMRPGGHEMTEADWEIALDFAETALD